MHDPSFGQRNFMKGIDFEARQGEVICQASKQWAKHFGYYDPLTGLPNRVLFYEQLDWAVRQARRCNRRFVMLLLDLDNFKIVNDSLGYTVGDALLVAVTERLVSTTRESNVVARFGGDEYAILPTDLKNTKDAALYAQRICDLLVQPFEVEGHRIHTSTSIGIAVYAAHGDRDPKDLLVQADIALNWVKEKERGSFKFYNLEMEAIVQ